MWKFLLLYWSRQTSTCVWTVSRGRKNGYPSPEPAQGDAFVKRLSSGVLPKTHRTALSEEWWARSKPDPSPTAMKSCLQLQLSEKLYRWTSPGMDCTPNSCHSSDKNIPVNLIQNDLGLLGPVSVWQKQAHIPSRGIVLLPSHLNRAAITEHHSLGGSNNRN